MISCRVHLIYILFIISVSILYLLSFIPANSSAINITSTIIQSFLSFSNGSIINNNGNLYNDSSIQYDKFGIVNVYPTKTNGKEWYINMTNPLSDPYLFVGADRAGLQLEKDGSWKIGGREVKLNVNAGSNEQWRDVEITGYIKVIGVVNSLGKINIDNGFTKTDYNSSELNLSHILETENRFHERNATDDPESIGQDLNWLARGGRHSSEVPCEGTSLIGILHVDGSSGWKKEIWHTGGYTKERGNINATTSILNKWIGWKVAMYNIDNNSKVRMESFIDENNTNRWKKVSEIIDYGGWYASSSTEIFNKGGCDRPKDYIIINSGEIASFRFDNLLINFKNFSIREITGLF